MKVEPTGIFSSGKKKTDLFIEKESRWEVFSPISLLVLCTMSVLFIRSAQAYTGGNQWKMQALWIIIGFLIYMVVSLLDYHFWMRFAHVFYVIGVASLLLVFLWPEKYGSQRWIDFGIFKIQPSEFAKIVTLILGASIMSRSEIGILKDSLKGIFKLGICFACPMFLIFKQPDLGSTLVFPPIAFSLLYVARIPYRFFVATALLFVVIIGVLGYDVFRYYQYKSENPNPQEAIVAYEDTTLIPLKDYQRKRILTFLAPEVMDPNGIGSNWNRIQALIAVATGGITGKGLGNGMQAKLGYLPSAVAHNDFIFAVLAEESGFVGGIIAIGAFFLLIFGCLKVASKASDRFGAMLAIGVSILLMTHVFINIGMTIGITPITGLPLPFLSYGGSFLISCFILLGLVQSVYRHRKEFR
ncbi:MAG: FtsW/RodA/SpoVE family cell cycle protein [Opitutales bacterium]